MGAITHAQCWLFVLVFSSAFIIMCHPAAAYKEAEHFDIGDKGLNVYVNNAESQDWLGLWALDLYYTSNIRVWFDAEDDYYWAGVPSYMWHFWDHRGGDNDGLGTLDSAYTRACNFWGDPYTLTGTPLFNNYVNGSISDAYDYLGCVGHLTMDMAVPAHVHNDQHAVQDWYECLYICNGGTRPNGGLANVYSTPQLRSLMLVLNDRADDWPSDNADAHDGGPTSAAFFVRNADGYVVSTAPGYSGAMIANDVYPAAIGHTAGLLRMFYNIVRPIVSLFGNVNRAYSGLNPPILYMTYTGFQGVACQQGMLYYSLASTRPDEYDSSAWLPLLENTGIDSQGRLVFDLSYVSGLNTLNTRMWLRGKVWDVRASDSHPAYLGYIDFDSRRPIIANITVN
jgi:hypothetical protein